MKTDNFPFEDEDIEDIEEYKNTYINKYINNKIFKKYSILLLYIIILLFFLPFIIISNWDWVLLLLFSFMFISVVFLIKNR